MRSLPLYWMEFIRIERAGSCWLIPIISDCRIKRKRCKSKKGNWIINNQRRNSRHSNAMAKSALWKLDGEKKKINQENDLLPNKKQKQKIRKKKNVFCLPLMNCKKKKRWKKKNNLQTIDHHWHNGYWDKRSVSFTRRVKIVHMRTVFLSAGTNDTCSSTSRRKWWTVPLFLFRFPVPSLLDKDSMVYGTMGQTRNI